MTASGPIGIFDSGYGGLTVLKEIISELPQYDYLYFGDNARAPYGSRSFETIYQYTLECVQYLFNQGCPLVILACNTASAKALRNIQQKDLKRIAPNNRVLGVIRPTAEVIGDLSQSKKIGILGTSGTVSSQSYVIEIHKLFPVVDVFQTACPLWVPLIENNELNNDGTHFFIEKYTKQLLSQSQEIDTILLACTHYPLLEKQIRQHIPNHIQLLSQGKIVATALKDYLTKHKEIEIRCLKQSALHFQTTDDTEDFNRKAGLFFGEKVQSTYVHL
jgi:glutamate racemase